MEAENLDQEDTTTSYLVEYIANHETAPSLERADQFVVVKWSSPRCVESWRFGALWLAVATDRDLN
jgi:hypothetical protein